MFSINRVYGEALLPDGATYTFWGKGLSQGHSDAVRRQCVSRDGTALEIGWVGNRVVVSPGVAPDAAARG